MSDLIVKSKIKEIVRDMSIAGDVAHTLNKIALEILERGVQRAKLNGRRTLQGRDL